MNVASLELCRELYELSGWDDLDLSFQPEGGNCPRYDLGYLLRKLPKSFVGKSGMLIFLSLSHAGNDWFANYETGGDSKAEVEIFDKIPEDAVCKLAIGLFKQGILKKEK